MPKSPREQFLNELARRYPSLRRVGPSKSLFEIPETRARVYIRYSKRHSHGKTFFGLRKIDLQWLEGWHSLICFIWDDQETPLLVPFSQFEAVFSSLAPASDGQFKVQVYLEPDSTQLYIPNAGRFNVDEFFGWSELNIPVGPDTRSRADSLTHSQVQSLLCSIGFQKGNSVWCPQEDRAGLDWSIAKKAPLHNQLPALYQSINPILSGVDVVWMKRGGGELVALYEVEHTTSIYLGLLRFNDVRLVSPDLCPRFSIIAKEGRRALYGRQIVRPTFQRSGLADVCTFMEYGNVLDWYEKITRGTFYEVG